MADLVTDPGSRLHYLRTRDYGFFGPDSLSWRVWSSPTTLVGFQRAVTLEFFDPFFTAALADMQGMYRQPRHRLDNTLAYFLTVVFADGKTAIEASESLMRAHAGATGIEPISGKRYHANNPGSQLLTHIGAWHSMLKCFEQYGPGPLRAEEDRQYWAECAVAAELLTCKPSAVPRSHDEVRAHYASLRPQLCVSDRAYENMQHLLRSPFASSGLAYWLGSRLIAPATIATIPGWMRKIAGIDQPALLDYAVKGPARGLVRAMGCSPRANWATMRVFAPKSGAILRQHFASDPPMRRSTITPERARDECRSTRALAE